MDNSTLFKHIELFREKAETQKLVVFVGAGVSRNVEGMPSWHTLVQKMAESISYSKCTGCTFKEDCTDEDCRFKNDFSNDEFLKIPQYVFNQAPALYDQILEENIKHNPVDAPLSSAIFDINPVHIITTNYDSLIEDSSNAFADQYQVIVGDRDLLTATKNKYIIKMHGDISQPETVVLKEQDYLNFSQEHILIELFIKALLTDHTVLFLGYSLNDYNIKLIINWLNYMRTENNAWTEGEKVGYIVLDESSISNTQLDYFSCNQLGVVNINTTPLVDDIPADLAADKGKRLYSFLKIIADSSLENDTDAIKRAAEFMLSYQFIERGNIFKLLHIKRCVFRKGIVQLTRKMDFDRICSFIKTETDEAIHLKQLFINAGILKLTFKGADFRNDESYELSLHWDASLHGNALFKLYLCNRYGDLQERINDANVSIIEKYFYYNILCANNPVADEYRSLDTTELSSPEKVSFLHNVAVADGLKSLFLDAKNPRCFIENIASSKQKVLFQFYLDMYAGNSKRLLDMSLELERLCSSNGSFSTHLDTIKNHAYTLYYLYFYNHITFNGYSDLKKHLLLYISALVAANRAVEDGYQFFGHVIQKDEYALEPLDIDIITKFIPTKELLALFERYRVKTLTIKEPECLLLADCFINMIDSIVDHEIYGFRDSTLSTLTNIAVLLNAAEIPEQAKEKVSTAISKFLGDDTVSECFFSIDFPRFRESITVFSILCDSVDVAKNIEMITKIVSGNEFFQFTYDVNFRELTQLIDSFIPQNDDNEIAQGLQGIIDTTESTHHKVILLRLFHKHITNQSVKNEYKLWLISNFQYLDIDAIYDFAFSDWLDITSVELDMFINETIRIYERETKGQYHFPGCSRERLDCVYILYINDRVSDISKLEVVSTDNPLLRFLLNPDTFDYEQVDFSHYMWVNFAQRDKYMHYFVKNKNLLIPKIKTRIEDHLATEDERKILYGYLLSKDELFYL